jgi:amidohydrolase
MIEQSTCEYVVKLRREIHERPEIGFDLTNTLAVVRRELDAMGIPYTEKFGKSSIVGTINPDCKGFTIGLRADMDALPIQEENDVPYASKNPGQMHACGHDAHTAILLATAKELKKREKELTCRVKLLFTPAEEYIQPGCQLMVEDGVMDDIDCAVALHVNPDTPVGAIRTIAGPGNANSTGVTVEFFGKNSHAADQQNGHDAIAMAVQAYMAMETMIAKEFKAKEPRIFNVGAFNGGHTNNVICDYCKMFCTIRTFSDEVTEKILNRMRQIADGVAAMSCGTAKVTVNKHLPYVLSDPIVKQKVDEAAAKVIGAENVLVKKQGMGGEDFSFMSRKKPSMQFNLGSMMQDPALRHTLHHPKFNIDEDCLAVGVKIFLQFVLDNMDGIQF